MPIKATTQSQEVQKAVDIIRAHCIGDNLSIFELSRLVGVSQPALSRFMRGQRKTVTATARRCLAYVKSQRKRHKWHSFEGRDGKGVNAIENAALSLWDGDPQTAEFVASIIATLKPTVDVALAALKGSQRKAPSS